MSVNYPIGIKRKKTKLNEVIPHHNRGMGLEDEINETNNYYKDKEIALIYKKPTPIKVVKTDEKKITLAYFDQPSTTDYCGVYKGRYIDFEAKSTLNSTSFPMSNFHPNQLKHLENVIRHNGIAFCIFSIKELDAYYLLLAKDMFDYLSKNKRKSLPFSFISKKGYEIKRGFKPPLDYIIIIDKLFF